MGVTAYRRETSSLRARIADLLRGGAPLDVVYISSGAAALVERGLACAPATAEYGRAKLADEATLQSVTAETGGRLCIVRAYALSGPYMTKPDAYALGNMILQALDGSSVEVLAERPVRRSYMAIDDMVGIATHALGELEDGQSITFETAGEVVEMGELASRVLQALDQDPTAVLRANFDPHAPADDYLGDPALVGILASRAGIQLASLDEQIALTAKWLRGNRHS